MKLDIYDTCVQTPDGALVHFDVLVPENTDKSAIEFARQWLNNMGISCTGLTHENCRYCHSESATPEIEHHINLHRYFILQMEGCPAPI